MTRFLILDALERGRRLPAPAARHRRRCPACNAFERRVRAVDRALRQPPPEAADVPFLHRRVMASVREAHAARKAPARATRRPLVVAVLVVMVACASVGVTRSLRSARPPAARDVSGAEWITHVAPASERAGWTFASVSIGAPAPLIGEIDNIQSDLRDFSEMLFACLE
jgi:hypothetical protein